MKKRKLRRKIADDVLNKMNDMNTCPNERDTILNVILSSKDRYSWERHCMTDCSIETCHTREFLNALKEQSNA